MKRMTVRDLTLAAVIAAVYAGLTLFLRPAWFSPTMPPPGSSNCTDTSLRAFIVCPGPF